MSEPTPPAQGQPEDTIPRFRVTEKKVDSSWKEEVRKEREAAQAAAAKGGKGAAAPVARTGGPAGASKVFVNFLAQLVQQGLVQLGHVENPFSGQREVDLDGARYTIDLLAVLQQKTKGNLSEQEQRMFTESLRELQLQYVGVAQAVGRQMKEQMQREQKGGKPPR
jgi:hypothetical protein